MSNGQIVTTKPTGAVTNARLQALEEMRLEIDMTCEIFRMDDKTARHLAQAVFLGRINNGLVPDAFKGNVESIYIMSKKAEQMNIDIIEVLQGGYFVHGRWGWSAEFMVNRVLSIGFFSKIEYISGGEMKDGTAWMRAVGVYPDGSKAEGTVISLAMAKAEGWIDKKGSKWATMPALMLRKRAQTFMIREYAPHAFSGDTRTHDELEDIAQQAARTSTGEPATVLDNATGEPVGNLYDKAEREEEERQRLEVLQRIESKIMEKYNTGDKILALQEEIGMSLDQVEGLNVGRLLAIWEVIK